MKVFYTFGSDACFSFKGGWVEVEAPTMAEAHAIFRANYPDKTPGVLNCADYYTEAQFQETKMFVGGNRRAFCHRKLSAKKNLRSEDQN